MTNLFWFFATYIVMTTVLMALWSLFWWWRDR